MSRFTSQRDWCRPEGAGYVATSELIWEVGVIGSGHWLIVPVGFYFDKSVPWPLRGLGRLKRFWKYFRVFDAHEPLHLEAAAAHDRALALGWDRLSAAGVFNDALNAKRIGRFERLFMALGVIVWRWK